MTHPQIEIIPLFPACRADVPVTQEVMIRITPPTPEVQLQRPALNLGLVMDRSGSMAAQNKIGFAREAAIYAVQQLLPTDRVSITLFDDVVETIVPNTLAENKARIVELLQRVQPGDTTALHGGWKEAGAQAHAHLLSGGLNRVILLSDGLANVGETNPDVIATDVNRLAAQGVSTTTMGVGDDYNEDLLEAMARSGDGNYYYIESPQQLADIFQSELHGLMATFGNTVSLGIEPQGGATLLQVLNELDHLPNGRLKLPNLVAGMPITVVVRLSIPPQRQEAEVCRFRVAWNAPKQGARQVMTVSLRLPVVDAATWATLTPNAEVQELVALLTMARHKKEATQRLEQGDKEGAANLLGAARQVLEAMEESPERAREAQALSQIEDYLASGELEKFTKHTKYQSHQRNRSEQYRNS